jgi:hypothetical protein
MKTLTLNRESVLALKRYVDAAAAEYADLSIATEPAGLIVKVGEFVWSPTIPATEA